MSDSKLYGFRVHSAARLFPLMAGSDFDALCQDIERRGLLEPAVLWKRGSVTFLLDGRNRLRACQQVGVEPRFVEYDGGDPTGDVVSHNLHRRHLTESQRAMVGARLIEVLEQEAPKDRGGRPSKEEPVTNRSQVSERNPPVRDQAAQMVNVGGMSVQRARKVQQHGSKELQAAVDAGVVRVDLASKLADRDQDEQRALVRKIVEAPGKNAKSVVRQHDRDKVSARIEAEPQPLPKGPFRTIVADPPWPYEKRKEDGSQRGQTLYPTMTLSKLAELGTEVQARAHQDAILWLWITNAHLVEGAHVQLLNAWGFTGKTILTWDKELIGTGDWLRGRTEHCILAVRGRPTIRLQGEHTIITEKRRAHSRKPEAFYDLVDKLCPGSKLELFSRTDRQGWVAWGAEAGKFEGELAV